jgi:hypothetical protein
MFGLLEIEGREAPLAIAVVQRRGHRGARQVAVGARAAAAPHACAHVRTTTPDR